MTAWATTVAETRAEAAICGATIWVMAATLESVAVDKHRAAAWEAAWAETTAEAHQCRGEWVTGTRKEEAATAAAEETTMAGRLTTTAEEAIMMVG